MTATVPITATAPAAIPGRTPMWQYFSRHHTKNAIATAAREPTATLWRQKRKLCSEGASLLLPKSSPRRHFKRISMEALTLLSSSSPVFQALFSSSVSKQSMMLAFNCPSFRIWEPRTTFGSISGVNRRPLPAFMTLRAHLETSSLSFSKS